MNYSLTSLLLEVSLNLGHTRGTAHSSDLDLKPLSVGAQLLLALATTQAAIQQPPCWRQELQTTADSKN